MRRTRLAALSISALLAVASIPAHADIFVNFSGPTVSGSLQLTLSATPDSKYPDSLEVSNISGTFSDTTLSISNATVTGLVAINHATPEATNLLAPNDFSKFGPLAGLPADNHGYLSYDNLYWPNGSPQTASDYPPHGGFLDIYGLMLSIDGGKFVDFWSNGGGGGYGVAVASSTDGLDYVGGGLAATTPEPSTWALLVIGFGGLGYAARRARREKPAAA